VLTAMSSFMEALDMLVVSTALPTIRTDLGVLRQTLRALRG
jgi:hypothetical protein